VDVFTRPAKAGMDLCVGFLDCCLDCGDFDFPQHARVLEVGCAEADTVAYLKERRPDLHITAIDWREVERPKADKLVRGDVLRYTFPPASFDCIVAVSTVEHIGLGAYGDPVDVDGDTHAMTRMASWVRPHGLIYVDVPYRPEGVYTVNENYRAYDDASVFTRLVVPSLTRVFYRSFDVNHPDAPYLAMGLLKA
jgi:SAM-dependent methyltransferase